MELKEQEILQSYSIGYYKHQKENPYYGKAELAIDGFTVTCKVEDFATPEEAVAGLKIQILKAMNRFYDVKEIMERKKSLKLTNQTND